MSGLFVMKPEKFLHRTLFSDMNLKSHYYSGWPLTKWTGLPVNCKSKMQHFTIWSLIREYFSIILDQFNTIWNISFKRVYTYFSIDHYRRKVVISFDDGVRTSIPMPSILVDHYNNARVVIYYSIDPPGPGLNRWSLFHAQSPSE